VVPRPWLTFRQGCVRHLRDYFRGELLWSTRVGASAEGVTACLVAPAANGGDRISCSVHNRLALVHWPALMTPIGLAAASWHRGDQTGPPLSDGTAAAFPDIA
jgi:hypothetical protein